MDNRVSDRGGPRNGGCAWGILSFPQAMVVRLPGEVKTLDKEQLAGTNRGLKAYCRKSQRPGLAEG